jgi:hypothetical protein
VRHAANHDVYRVGTHTIVVARHTTYQNALPGARFGMWRVSDDALSGDRESIRWLVGG